MKASTFKTRLGLGLLLLPALLGKPLLADSLSLPNRFAAGTPAVADEVNANFDAVKTAVDNNDQRVAQLENEIATLKTLVTTLQDRITTLDTALEGVKTSASDHENRLTSQQDRIAELENNNVQALNDKVERVTDDNGYDTVRFTGVNLQIVNGIDQITANGLGNLIIGYNTARMFGSLVCSSGQYTDQTSCENAGETWAQSHKSGSHNLVGGNENSYSATGGMVLGLRNIINQNYAVVSGGLYNRASGSSSSVGGGQFNTANGVSSSVSGGFSNTASGRYSSVSGGSENTAIGKYSSVSGGRNRSATGTHDWAAGSLFEDQ